MLLLWLKCKLVYKCDWSYTDAYTKVTKGKHGVVLMGAKKVSHYVRKLYYGEY